MNLLYIETHGNTLGNNQTPPPKGQVSSSNLAWDTNEINELGITKLFDTCKFNKKLVSPSER